MISVVIPLYNKEQYILPTLHSLLEQQGVEFEVIVVDDGSTDGSVAAVERLQDKRITLVQQPNGGPSSARNTGVRHAHFDWVLYLDADDKLLPDALATFAKYIRSQQGIDCFCCNFYTEQGGKRRLFATRYPEGLIPNNFRAFLFHRCFPRTGTAVFRKDFLSQHPFKEYLRRYEDLEQLFQMFPYGKFYRISQPLFVYNTDGCAASQPRKNWKEDFAAYIDIDDQLSWRNIALYDFFLKAKNDYPIESFFHYKEYSRKKTLYCFTLFIKFLTKLI